MLVVALTLRPELDGVYRALRMPSGKGLLSLRTRPEPTVRISGVISGNSVSGERRRGGQMWLTTARPMISVGDT
jgi:hypothetical protein